MALDDKIDNLYAKPAVGTSYGEVSFVHKPEQEEHQNRSLSRPYESLACEPIYTQPTPQIAVNDYETFYSLHSANSFRVNGKTYVLPRILGFMSPVDESGVLRTYSAGASFPVNDGVKNSVNRHEVRHNWIHDEHTNREQDKAEGTDAYNK